MAKMTAPSPPTTTIPDPSIINEPCLPPSAPWTIPLALSTHSTPSPTPNHPTPIPYIHLLERLKLTKREGWRRHGIHHGESIADHSWRMAMICLTAAPESLIAQGLDVSKCVRMALTHDLAESVVSDLIPSDGVAKAEKRRREGEVLGWITGTVMGGEWGRKRGGVVREEWEDFEKGETLEARFVGDVDKVELLLQMVEYERRGGGKVDLADFAYVATKVELEEMKAWAEEILREREVFWEGVGVTSAKVGGDEVNRGHSDRYYSKE